MIRASAIVNRVERGRSWVQIMDGDYAGTEMLVDRVLPLDAMVYVRFHPHDQFATFATFEDS